MMSEPGRLSTKTLSSKWSALDASESSVVFSNVTKRYPDGTLAVDDVTLTCPAGQVTVFVGPSGCGKTTSLRMINRMIEPSDGSIVIGGVDTRRLDATTLRRQMGYVIQNAGLFPHRRILENIATVPRLLGVPRATARERAVELMERVGLHADLGTKYPYQLSGGQQQRVGVARALAADPPVLLMDEPFSAVDPVVRIDLQNELLRLQADIGKTIVFVTHDIDEAVRLGDQIVVFQRGGTVAQHAAPADVLTEPENDFVRTFVGSDAGLKWLSLLAASDVVTTPSAVVERAGTEWLLELDEDWRPQRWRGGGDVREVGAVFDLVATNMRQLLDGIVSSPVSAAIAVHADGSYRGLVEYGAVGTVVNAARMHANV